MAAEYTCTLNERDLKVAQDELGEIPKERLGQVETFRKWILQQPHIKCRTDTKFLLRFLRTAKFSQLRARTKLENFLTAKMKNPDWLKDLDMADPKMQKFLESGYLLPLPPLPDGKKVVLCRGGCLDTSNKHYTKLEVMRSVIGLFLHCMEEESAHVQGFTYLLDMTDVPMSTLTYFGVDDMRRSLQLWQNGFPARLKAFHYYNCGSVFEAFMVIARPVMSKKMQDRIHIHGSNLETVYEHFPMSILPDEYLPDDYTGPSAGSVKSLIDKTKADLSKPEVRNRILLETSDEFTIDLSKKPDDEPQESFRKLNVD